MKKKKKEKIPLTFFFFFIATLESRLIQRNFYWYTKGKEERLQNKSTPFGFDHLPSQTVLCLVIIYILINLKIYYRNHF